MSEASGATGLRAQGRVGTVINGKWRIEARLGAGGMSTVYAVVDRRGARAALKMLNLQLSREESVRSRFLREGYLANSVAHPGVCQVLEDGYSEDGCAYLVLELLEGETMESRRLRMGGAMPLDEVLDVADQMLATIAAAHEKGIVHRDVKPENVFLTNDGQVKLLDFGLARMRDATMEATATGITIGTPEFMPPEQALGKSDLVDARSDVWGVGATIFTALSGKYVHETNTLHEQLVASATRRARSVLTVVPHLPRAIAQVVDKALELEQGDRWPSAGDMQRALRQARGLPLPNFGGPPSVTARVDVPNTASPISSDRTLHMSPPSSDGPTLESAVQPRPPIPNPRQTERLTPGLLGASQTMHMHPPYASSHPRVSAPPPAQHVSSGSMPSAQQHVLPPQQHNLGASSSYPFVQLPLPPPERRGGRGAIVASTVLLLGVILVTIYLYLRGTPHLP